MQSHPRHTHFVTSDKHRANGCQPALSKSFSFTDPSDMSRQLLPACRRPSAPTVKIALSPFDDLQRPLRSIDRGSDHPSVLASLASRPVILERALEHRANPLAPIYTQISPGDRRILPPAPLSNSSSLPLSIPNSRVVAEAVLERYLPSAADPAH